MDISNNSLPLDSGQKVVLDVGGTLFKTTVSTLTRSPVFEKMLNGYWSVEVKFDEAKEEIQIFLDRDPLAFGHVLRHLRGYPVAPGKSGFVNYIQSTSDKCISDKCITHLSA